jgi:aminoglycoside phosphotransferase (APT) family kinase protein
METEEALAALCRWALPERPDARVVAVEALPADRHPTTAFVLEWRERPPGAALGSRCSVLGGTTTGPTPAGHRAPSTEHCERSELRREALVLRWHRWCEPLWALEDSDRAEREFALHRALEARGFPVPHVYAWGREEGGWVLMSRSPHVPSSDHRSLSDPPDAWGTRLEALLREGMCWLARLHAIPPDAVDQVPLPRVTLAGVIAQARAWAAETRDDALLSAIERTAAGASVEEWPTRLLHGNVHPATMRPFRRRLSIWMGWEDSALGDPRWDLARLANWLASPSVPPAGRSTTDADPPELLTRTLRMYADARRTLEASQDRFLACPELPVVFPATLALRDWSLRRCRQARLAGRLGPDHPDVTGREPAVQRARQRCERWLTRLR